MQEEEEDEALGNWLRASASAAKDDSRGCGCDERVLSANKSGVDDVQVVTDDVVMPINVVVTIVSMSGDESVVYVGVWVDAVAGVVVVPPPVDDFFSNLLLLSPGADGPPRQGKQHRNSVERNIVTRFHDFSRFFF